MRISSIALIWAPLALLGCEHRQGARPSPAGALSSAAGAQVALLAAFDFPHDDPRGRELSGIAWDGAARALYAVSDTVPVIVPLRPSADYRAWSFGAPIIVRISDVWDGEGIALTPQGFLVANERGPHVYALDRAGNEIGEVPLPPHFASCVVNKALESLSLTPDGRYLFTANESTLLVDGPQPSTANGATVRIFRRDLETGTDVEYAYRTDPIFAPGPKSDMGVSDVLALSSSEVLVMERSYVPDVGNSIRIYRSVLDDGNVIDVKNLSLATTVARKTLFLDFATLPGAEMVGGGRNHFPNYEGLALGPTLSDGRRILFVISDDNANPDLVTRILVLAVADMH